MNRKELIERLMNLAENYKEGYLYQAGAVADIGVLIDEYTKTVVKNYSIPVALGQSEQLCIKCKEAPANRGLGKHKSVCSDCWNSLCD